MININLVQGGRIVKGNKLVYIYLNEPNPVPVYNITSVDIHTEATAISGTLLLTTFPSDGLDIFNRDLGAAIEYETSTSGIVIKNRLDFESNLRRGNIPISGSKLGGRF